MRFIDKSQAANLTGRLPFEGGQNRPGPRLAKISARASSCSQPILQVRRESYAGDRPCQETSQALHGSSQDRPENSQADRSNSQG